jgi:hypothetical protein
MLPVLLALTIQAAPPQSVDRPIRVWLGTEQPVVAGEPVQVFVRTALDGYLTVLRRGTDGRIEVLFPTAPADEAFVTRGTYEIRRDAEGSAFVALEAPGTGLVLAALSATPFRTHEFVHQATWSPTALAPSWAGADAEGALTDIVQRMIGDGYFVYDLVPYTVSPPRAGPRVPSADALEYDTCVGCVFTNVTVLVTPTPVLVCDPFFLVCEDLFFFRPRHQVDQPRAEPPGNVGRVLGIPSGGARLRGVAARPPIAARPRTPTLRGRQPPQIADALTLPKAPRRRVVSPSMPVTPAPSRPAPVTSADPSATRARSRATLVVSASNAPSVVARTRTRVASPRTGTASVNAGSVVSNGQARARARAATPATAVPGTVESRARVRAGVAARKRQ